MRTIDLNADVGEGPGEEALYPLVTSVNVACGGHTGDARSMGEAVARAVAHGVAIGAHPSYPDRGGFGRSSMRMDPTGIASCVEAQVAELGRVARAGGARMGHVKPHGALYNDAASDRSVADAVAEAVARLDPSLVLVGLAGSTALDAWRARGLRVAAEGFADRAYAPDGRLVSRALPGALLTDAWEASSQALRLAHEGRCETLCVHADTPGAAAILLETRRRLLDAGFALRAFAGW